MGRHKLSTAVMEARGAFKKDPQLTRGPEAENTNPLGAPPVWLSTEQREIWMEIANEAPPGVLSQSERQLVTMYCGVQADIRRMGRDIAAWHEWQPGFDGEKNPEPEPKPISPGLYSRMESMLGKMGMSPADRARVGVAPPQDASDFDDI